MSIGLSDLVNYKTKPSFVDRSLYPIDVVCCCSSNLCSGERPVHSLDKCAIILSQTLEKPK